MMNKVSTNCGLVLELLKAPVLLLLTLITLMVMLPAILLSMYANDTTLYSKCDQSSDLWQQLELASDLQDLEDTGLGKGVVC